MGVKKLIVGTVFANDGELQQKWLDLQLRYLAATTEDYDHFAVLMGEMTNDYFQRRTNVMFPEDKTLGATDAHIAGVRQLLDYFRLHQSEYQNFLWIDGDAFPIRKQWMGSLLARMQPQDRFDDRGVALPGQKGRDYEIAICLRSENLEQRLHCSVLFAKKCALPHISFADAIVGDDLAGNPEGDLHLPVYQRERRRMAFPLIRSNQHNLHPLAFGIYYDMFYHHSCGSGRWFNLRAKDYYSRIIPPLDDLGATTDKLFHEPNEFIRKLAGWSPARYGTV